MLDNLMMLVVYCDQGSNSKWILLLIFANMMTFFMMIEMVIMMVVVGVECFANPSYGAVRLKLRPQWHNLRTTSRKLMMMIRMMMTRMMVNNMRNTSIDLWMLKIL